MFARKSNAKSVAGVLGELLLIVVGINIALWFEGMVEDRQEAEVERQYLDGLAEDISADLEELDDVIAYAEDKIDQLAMALDRLDGIAGEKNDIQQSIVFMPSSYRFFEASDFTYQAMQESGDFRLLSDREIKSELLRLMRRYRQIETLQTNFLEALDEIYIPITMRAFDLQRGRLADDGVADNLGFRNFFVYTMNDTRAMLWAYGKARDTARSLLDRIQDDEPQ